MNLPVRPTDKQNNSSSPSVNGCCGFLGSASLDARQSKDRANTQCASNGKGRYRATATRYLFAIKRLIVIA
eukprot:scaffold207983_cov21-Prasinocladus_malaysianus.AAC.1